MNRKLLALGERLGVARVFALHVAQQGRRACKMKAVLRAAFNTADKVGAFATVAATPLMAANFGAVALCTRGTSPLMHTEAAAIAGSAVYSQPPMWAYACALALNTFVTPPLVDADACSIALLTEMTLSRVLT